MSDPIDQLNATWPLGAEAQAFLESLPAAEGRKLAQAVLDARESQARKVESALDGAISFVPAPLRRQARKLLFS